MNQIISNHPTPRLKVSYYRRLILKTLVGSNNASFPKLLDDLMLTMPARSLRLALLSHAPVTYDPSVPFYEKFEPITPAACPREAHPLATSTLSSSGSSTMYSHSSILKESPGKLRFTNCWIKECVDILPAYKKLSQKRQ
jgi:hypothetical protein